MKLKRISAFLIMVFILSGCMSDVSLNGTLENTKQAAGTVKGSQFANQHKLLMKEAQQRLQLLTAEETSYVIEQESNKKLLDHEQVQSAFATLAQMSEAEQYAAPEDTSEEVSANVEASNSFYVRTTLYGVDCYGCSLNAEGSGNTATGVMLNPTYGVMQSNGTWLSGLTYDGYYIIATDGSIPFYSIIEISNHGLSGMGFSPDQPIQCIVLDRGGAISGNHIDLYIGSEANVGNISYDGSTAVATILRYGR